MSEIANVTNQPYEVLLRWNIDRLVAAHVGMIEVGRDADGAVVLEANGSPASIKVLPVRPLATAGPEFEAVIGQAVIGMAAQHDAAVSQAEDAAAVARGLRTQLQASQGATARAQAALDAARLQVAALTAQLAAK